jgi:hypothetical protein
MSLLANKSRLESLTKDLAASWAETRDSWRDAKSQEFAQRFMDELFSSVTRTATCIADLDKIINKVRHDCE